MCKLRLCDLTEFIVWNIYVNGLMQRYREMKIRVCGKDSIDSTQNNFFLKTSPDLKLFLNLFNGLAEYSRCKWQIFLKDTFCFKSGWFESRDQSLRHCQRFQALLYTHRATQKNGFYIFWTPQKKIFKSLKNCQTLLNNILSFDHFVWRKFMSNVRKPLCLLSKCNW